MIELVGNVVLFGWSAGLAWMITEAIWAALDL